MTKKDSSKSLSGSNPTMITKNKGRVYILPGFAHNLVRKYFSHHGYQVVESLSESDIVVFLGGDDINPKLYQEQPAGAEAWDDERDKFEIEMYAQAEDRFKIGICRGGQLLNVLNGGSLWQDVNNHGSGVHMVTDFITNEKVLLNSLHHQQMRPTDDAEVIAGCHLSSAKDCYSGYWSKSPGCEDVDVEAVWYGKTKSLCFQPHPQLQIDGPTGNYFVSLLDRYYHAA